MKKIIIANWKMSLSLNKSLVLLKQYQKKLKALKIKHQIVICPDFLCLAYLSAQPEKKRDLPFYLGGQNCGHLSYGALTGEVSAFDLKKINSRFIIIGHSERRQAGESRALIKKKLHKVLEAKLRPIICLGEDKQQAVNKVDLVIEKEIKEIFSNLSNHQVKNIIIAYEPVWAIGTNQACSPSQASRVQGLIKQYFIKNYSLAPLVVYGGSVNGRNAKQFLSQANIDGLLVGGASLTWSEFNKIINQ